MKSRISLLLLLYRVLYSLVDVGVLNDRSKSLGNLNVTAKFTIYMRTPLLDSEYVQNSTVLNVERKSLGNLFVTTKFSKSKSTRHIYRGYYILI